MTEGRTPEPGMTPSADGEVDATRLAAFVAALFRAAGLSEQAARIVSEDLVEADLSGQPSHGVMLVDMYLDRLRAGSVTQISCVAGTTRT